MRARRVERARREDGVALVVSMAVVMLVTIMVVTVTAIALYQSSATGRDRQRSAAVSTAEGLLDSLVADVNGSAPAALPCGTLADSDTVVRDTLNSSATITYFDADVTTPIDCGLVDTSPPSYASVKVTTTAVPIGDTLPAVRTVETLLRLSPTYSSLLDKALFSSTAISIGNNGDVLASEAGEGFDADVYTNGSLTNDGGSNQVIEGDLMAQTNIVWNKSMVVTGNVWAKGNVTLSHSSISVGEDVLSATGTVTLNSGAAVLKHVRAWGSITWPGNCTAANCFPGDSVEPPPTTTMPEITWAFMSDWQANGYGTPITFADSATCGATVGTWIRDNVGTLTEPTIVEARCSQPVKLDGVNKTLSDNLAVFSQSGFSMKSTTLAGNAVTPATDPRLLYLIHPYGSTCTAGTPSITTNSGVHFVNKIAALLYTPCAADLAQQTNIDGQVYAGGKLAIGNNSEITYAPLSAWGIAASNQIASYRVELLYKRENVSG